MFLLKVDSISIKEYISRHSPKDNLIMVDVHSIISFYCINIIVWNYILVPVHLSVYTT